MDVKITKFDVEQIIKNNGIQIDISEPNGGDRLGDLTITKTKLIWCAGKTHKKHGTGLLPVLKTFGYAPPAFSSNSAGLI